MSCTIAAHDERAAKTRTVSLIARDVSERRALEAELVRQANYHLLTGLPNRAVFLDHLDRALARSRSPRWGHRAVLRPRPLQDRQRQPGPRRRRSTPELRGHPALLGDASRRHRGPLWGDEFVVLCHDVTEAEAVACAERLLEVVAVPVPLDGTEVRWSGSIRSGHALRGPTGWGSRRSRRRPSQGMTGDALGG